MGKSTAIVVAVLALLTGLVLGQLQSLAVPHLRPESSKPVVPARALATARSFYEEVNAFLTSGDRAVESILAPDFVDHAGEDRDAEELMAGLAATRAALPQLQLEIVDLQSVGALIAVQLEFAPGTPFDIPGFPLTISPSGRVVEFLRIQRSTVAERWSNDDRLPGMTLDLHTDFEHKGPDVSEPAIERLSLASGQMAELSGRGPVVLLVDSGQLRIEQTGVDQQGTLHPSSEPLDSGEYRIVVVDGKLQVRSLSGDAAEFWAFSMYGLYPAEPPSFGRAAAIATPGIAATAMAYTPLQLTDAPAAPLRLSVTQITLPTGAWVAPHTPGIVEEIVVLDGALEASLGSGRALLSSGDNQAQPFDGIETASAGQGFSAGSAATLSYRVSSAQPATLLIMTIASTPAPSS